MRTNKYLLGFFFYRFCAKDISNLLQGEIVGKPPVQLLHSDLTRDFLDVWFSEKQIITRQGIVYLNRTHIFAHTTMPLARCILVNLHFHSVSERNKSTFETFDFGNVLCTY